MEPNVLKRIELCINNFEKIYGKLAGDYPSPRKEKLLVRKPKGL